MFAQTTVQRRLPEASTMSELSGKKKNLVDEMSEFTKEGDRVNPTDSQLRLAEELVLNNDRTRYTKIPFADIIRSNQVEGHMDMMATAFDVLFRYTVNMLKLKRPRNWHTIKFTNAQFKARADCMVGTRNILKIMGYTQPVFGEDGKQNGLSYPDPSQIVQDYIKLIAAELLIAKTEIKLALEGNMPIDPYFLPGPSNVQLENLNPLQERPYNLDEMYSSNINPPHMSPQISSRQFPSQYDPVPPNYQSGLHVPSGYGRVPPNNFSSSRFPSQYDRAPPSNHGSEDSYRTNPSQGSMDPSLQHHPSFQHPNSYGQSNFPQPLGSQHHGGQSGHHCDHQSRGQGSQQRDYHATQDMTVEDIESSSSTSAYSGDDSDMSAKLELLKQKKADIWKHFAQETPSTEHGNNLNLPMAPQPQTKPRSVATMPITVLDEQPQVLGGQPRVPGGQPPIPKPRKGRQPLANPPPIQEDESLPSGTPNVAPSTNQGGPAQRPQAAPRKVRTMMECDMCEYPNHEKAANCVDCGNPKNERWRKIQMPGKSFNNPLPLQGPEAPPQPVEPMPVAQASTPPLSNRAPPPHTRYDNHLDSTVQFNDQATGGVHYNDPPIAAANRASSGQHGASSSVASTVSGAPLKDFIPPKKFTEAEKEERRKQAEALREMEMAGKQSHQHQQQQQQQEHHSSRAERGGGYQNYLPRNDNYNWDGQKNGTTEPLRGSVLQTHNAARLVDPGDVQLYRSLASQGHLVIQDIKDGLRNGYKLEEIQVATELQHNYQRPSDFLAREWNNYVERTMFLVNQLSIEEHKKRKMTGNIGNPDRREIIQYLIEEGGNCDKAAQKCCASRLKMIQDLMKEIGLPQSDAVRALERNGLDVNKAVHAVYRDKINNNQLYEYMWGKLEGGGIRQMQNERVEEMITKKVHNDDYLQRLLMAEYKLPTSANCDVLIQLVRDCGLTLGACLDVAKINDDVEEAKHLLSQDCPTCYVSYTRNEMVNMINCDHAVCQNCFVAHFSIMVKEKNIKHYNCPLCGEPDMTSEAIDVELYLQLFSGLIQSYMDKSDYEMFTQKINEHSMIKDPNFRWCIKCSTGFLNEARIQKLQCPNPTCGEKMCFLCKKLWEDQHDNLNCEQFAAWKKDNDPELQAQGLAAYLNEEGIECPGCGFKYALAKGGCMHFRCTQCPVEFCSGCNKLFRKAEDCTKYESCRKKGLHAHHPRDCLFFLRDESVEDLQKLLNENNVEFDTNPPQGQVDAEAAKEMQAQGQQAAGAPAAAAAVAATPALKCRVMLQKEMPDGPPIDEECGNAVQIGHAGLCLKHYKEYLVFKVNQNHIDPLPLSNTGQLQAILGRDEVKVPDRQQGEGEEQYAERLRQLIKEKIPLQVRAATMNF